MALRIGVTSRFRRCHSRLRSTHPACWPAGWWMGSGRTFCSAMKRFLTTCSGLVTV